MKNAIGELKAMLIVFAIIMGVIGVGYFQYRIFSDCGWIGLLKGAEWLWLFGKCQ